MRHAYLLVGISSIYLISCAGSPYRVMWADKAAATALAECNKQGFSSLGQAVQCKAEKVTAAYQTNGSPKAPAVMWMYSQTLPLAREVDEGRMSLRDYQVTTLKIEAQANQMAMQAYAQYQQNQAAMWQAAATMQQNQQHVQPTYSAPMIRTTNCNAMGNMMNCTTF